MCYYINTVTGDIDTLEGWKERHAVMGANRFLPITLKMDHGTVLLLDDTGDVIGEDKEVLFHRVYSRKINDYIPIIEYEELDYKMAT